MKNTVIKFGSYGLLTAVVMFLLALWLGQTMDYSTQEIVGYITMVASLSFIYFGIKHYRDKVNNGLVSFGEALAIGTLISAFVGFGIGVADYLYTTVINPDFSQEFLDKSLQTMQATLSPEEFEVEKAKLIQQMEDYGGSEFLAFIMFITVLLIGIVISLISGLILQRK